MRCLLPVAAVALGALAACNPTLNWREARFDDSTLVALLPCKPDKAARPALLAGKQVAMQLLGCEAGGATFAVARTAAIPGAEAGAVLAQWKAATLARLGSTVSQDAPFVPAGALDLPQSLRAQVQGRGPDGRQVTAQLAWFAHAGPQGVELFHAAVHAEKLDAQGAETFLAGLKFR